MPAKAPKASRALTEADLKRIEIGRPVSSWLPIKTANGVRIDTFTCSCSRCGRKIPDGDTSVTCAQPIPGVQVIEGFAICVDCRLATPVLLRFMPDGRFEGPHPKTGRWSSWRLKPPRPAWWDLAGWIDLTIQKMVRRRTARISGER